MVEVHLLLGSNKGNREAYMASAIRLLQLRCGTVTGKSSLYETEAWGEKQQSAFLNQAVKLYTALTPTDLLTAIKSIETETGRTLSTHWGPREIDIDILFYGNKVLNLPQLQVPHPYLHERKFTLAPLCEIAAQLIHPVLQKSVNQLLEECNDESGINIHHPIIRQ